MIVAFLLRLHSVEFDGAARVDCRHGQASLLQIVFALLAQMLFQQQGISRVGLESSIYKVAHEWNEADGEVEDDVEHHLDLNR